jgi:hypothetical protein
MSWVWPSLSLPHMCVLSPDEAPEGSHGVLFLLPIDIPRPPTRLRFWHRLRPPIESPPPPPPLAAHLCPSGSCRRGPYRLHLVHHCVTLEFRRCACVLAGCVADHSGIGCGWPVGGRMDGGGEGATGRRRPGCHPRFCWRAHRRGSGAISSRSPSWVRPSMLPGSGVDANGGYFYAILVFLMLLICI